MSNATKSRIKIAIAMVVLLIIGIVHLSILHKNESKDVSFFYPDMNNMWVIEERSSDGLKRPIGDIVVTRNDTTGNKDVEYVFWDNDKIIPWENIVVE